MPQAALFMGPMARKKVVHEQYDPNSYRIISQQAEDSFKPRQNVKTAFTVREDFNILGQMKDVRPSIEFRHNQPNPRQVGFLRQDVRLLNEPVCDVHTISTHPEQYKWWNHHIPNDVPSLPQHTLDSTARDDFQFRGSDIRRNTRHSSNPNIRPVNGAVPVTMLKKADGNQRWLKEGISYEHQYNSRLDPSYPVRGKRHGGFVWDEIPSQKVDKMVQEYRESGYLSPASEKTSRNSPVSVHPDPPSHVPATSETNNTTSVPVLPPISAL